MPDPGSHAFDIDRTRRRGALERDAVPSVPDEHADEEARAELEQDNPPRLVDSPRAAGPAGAGSGVGGAEADGGLDVRSSAFSDNDFLPARFSKIGDDVSPPLEWSAVPDGTAELAVVCEDPDAPGQTFLHWALLHVDPGTTSLDEGEVPPGATAARNGFGDQGWGGPLPPVGDAPHRYVFRVYALDERVRLPADADAEQLRTVLREHAVAFGTLVARFAR